MAQIIIEAEITSESWQYPETPELRIYALADFHTFNGVHVLRGTPGTDEPHLKIPCSVTGEELLIPSFEIASTTDSPDNPYARYTAELRLPSGKRVLKLGEFAIDPAPSGTTWENLTIQRKRGQYLRNPPAVYATLWDLQRMMDTKVGVLAKASETAFGGVYLLDDPVDPTFPIALGPNSPQVAGGFIVYASKYASLNLAHTAMSVLGGGTVVVDAPMPVTADLVMDPLVGLRFEGQGILTGAAAINPTGPFSAERRQIFGPGIIVSFAGNTSITQFPTQWWGENNNVSTQAAVDSLDSALGGNVKMSGTYVFTQNVNVNGKSNVEVSGEGRGRTVIDATGIAEADRQNGAAFVGASGTICFSSASAGTTGTNNSIRDLTILGPTVIVDATYGSDLSGHSLTLVNQTDFTAERIELDGSVGETFYILAYEGKCKNLRILNGNFKNVPSTFASGVVDTNSVYVDGLLLTGCHFEDVNFAVHVLGRNIEVVNNSFTRVAQTGIAVAETNDLSVGSLFGAVVSGNVFSHLGFGATASPAVGIDVRSRTPLYASGHHDFGTLVCNNIFVNSVADMALNCIRLLGSAVVTNNYGSGIEPAPGSAFSNFIAWDGLEEATNRLYIYNNVLQGTLASANFNYGIAIAQTADTFVYLSGNNISADILSIYITPGTSGNGATQPFISFNGDVFNGEISVLTVGSIDASGVLNNTPLYGDTTSDVRTASSISIAGPATLANTTTPSVKGKSLVYADFPAPIVLTNLTNGVTGQKLTLWCNNANMTINNGGNFILNGAFVGAQFKTLTLMRRETDWLEIDRH